MTGYHQQWNMNHQLAVVINQAMQQVEQNPPQGFGTQTAWSQQQAQPQNPQVQQQDPMMMSMQGSGSIVDSVVREMNDHNDKYYENVKTAVNNLVDAKVAVHAHDKVLDDQIDEFKDKIAAIEGNTNALDEENTALNAILAQS